MSALNWEQLANEVGLDARHMRRLRKEPGAPSEPDPDAWREWLNGRKKGMDELKAELLAEQIRKLKLANDALEKQLVPIDEVFSALRPTLSAFRTALDNLAHRAALKIGQYQETVEILQTEVDIALRTFQGAAWFDEEVQVDIAPLQVDTSDIPPAEGQAKPKGKPGRKPKAT